MVKKVALATLFSLIVLVIAAISAQYVYAEQLPPGITIAGNSFTGQNRLALQASLDALFKQYDQSDIVLTLSDKQLHVHFSDAGLKPNTDAMIDNALSFTEGKLPGEGTARTVFAIATKHNDIPFSLSVDDAKKHLFLDDTLHPAFGMRPKDATLNLTDTTVDITPGVDGLWIDDDAVVAGMIDAFTSGQRQLAVPNKIQKPDVAPLDLTVAQSEAQALLARDVTLQGAGKNIKLTRADIMPWIILGQDQGQYHARLDAVKIKSYLTDTVAAKINTKPVTQVTDKDGNITSSGQDGTVLVVDDSVTSIENALAKQEDKTTIVLSTKTNDKTVVVNDPQLGCDPAKAAGKYIEINLTMQKMCLYDGGTFVNTYRVSTGKWSTPTPVGTYAIQNKIDLAYSAAYGLYMPHWSAITPDGLYGIHGLPYNSSFHEDPAHIGEARSHGCIRLGPGDDVTVHDWADIGDPVFIHK